MQARGETGLGAALGLMMCALGHVEIQSTGCVLRRSYNFCLLCWIASASMPSQTCMLTSYVQEDDLAVPNSVEKLDILMPV